MTTPTRAQAALGGLTTAYKHRDKAYTRPGLAAMNSYERREARYRAHLGLSPEEPVEPEDVARFVSAMARKAAMSRRKRGKNARTR